MAARLCLVCVCVVLCGAAPPAPSGSIEPLPSGALLRIGDERFRLPGRWADAHYLASADGRLIAWENDGAIEVWQAADGRRLCRLTSERPLSFPGAFSLDGRWLAVHDGSSCATVFSLRSGRPHATVSLVRPGQQLALSPDGRQLASWDGNSLGVGEVPCSTRLLYRSLPGHDGYAAFSPDGRTVCYRPNEHSLCLLNVRTGASRRLSCPLAGKAVRYSWSPDGKRLAMTSDRLALVAVVDTHSGRLLHLLPNTTRFAPTAFSPDGRWLAVVGEDRVDVWDVLTGGLIGSVPRADGGIVGFMAFRENRDLLLLAEPEDLVTARDVRTGLRNVGRADYRGRVQSVAFTGRGRCVATLGEDQKVRLWDVRTGGQRRVVALQEGSRDRMLLSDDADVAVLAGGTQAVVTDLARGSTIASLSDAREADEPYRLYRTRTAFDSFTLSANGRWMTEPWVGEMEEVNSADGLTVRGFAVRCTATGRLRGVIRVEHEPPHALSPDGRFLALAEGGAVHLIDLGSGQERRRLAGLVDEWRSSPWGGYGLGSSSSRARPQVVFSPDGRMVGTLGANHVHLWDCLSGRRVAREPLPRDLELDHPRLVLTNTGRALLIGWSCSGDVEAVVWDVASRRYLCRFEHPTPGRPLALSPDGRRLALAPGDSTVLIYDVPGLESPGEKLSDGRLWSLWRDLGGLNARRAWDARLSLSRVPAQAVSLISEWVKPARPHPLGELVARLDAPQFPVREAAERQLAAAMAEGDTELEEHLDGVLVTGLPLETHLRVQRLLRPARGRDLTVRQLQTVRAVQVLEGIATPEATALLRRLAGGAPGLVTREASAALDRLAE